MNYFLSNFVSPVNLTKFFPHGLFPSLIDMNTRGEYGLDSLSRNLGKRKQKMREEVSQAMTYNYLWVIYALQLFWVIIDMQNCTYLLSFDICIHPWNHCPNQDNKYIYLLPKVSLCPFIDSFVHFYFKPSSNCWFVFCHYGLNFLQFYINRTIQYVLFLSGFFHST